MSRTALEPWRLRLRTDRESSRSTPTRSTRGDGSRTAIKYEIFYADGVDAILDALPPKDFKNVERKISALASEPRPIKSKKISESVRRVRAGDWRIFYIVDDKAAKIIVTDVVRRNEDTYKDI